MYKKMFSFAGLAISFIVGLLCMVNSFSAFSSVALAASYDSNPGNSVAYGVGYLFVGLILLALSLAGIVMSIIFLIKNKELKFPIVPILVLACAAVLFLGFNIMVIVSDATSISNVAKNMGDSSNSKIIAYYVMRMMTSLLDIFVSLTVTLVVAVLGALSLIPFKRKSA